jgi:uncharacterized protein (TIGR02246 family)
MTEQDVRAVTDRYLAAVRGADWETAFALFADDAVLRVPGRPPHGGEHRGRDAIVGYFRAALALAPGEVEVEVVDVLVGSERVAFVVRERFPRPEGVVEIRRANVYRVHGGRIVEVDVYEGDQAAVDALFAGVGEPA